MHANAEGTTKQPGSLAQGRHSVARTRQASPLAFLPLANVLCYTSPSPGRIGAFVLFMNVLSPLTSECQLHLDSETRRIHNPAGRLAKTGTVSEVRKTLDSNDSYNSTSQQGHVLCQTVLSLPSWADQDGNSRWWRCSQAMQISISRRRLVFTNCEKSPCHILTSPPNRLVPKWWPANHNLEKPTWQCYSPGICSCMALDTDSCWVLP